MEKPCIVGIGELLWDELPEGRRCGGAPANAVYHAAYSGAEGFVISALGNDPNGDALLRELQNKGVDTSYISRNDQPTGRVSVTLQGGHPEYEIHAPAAWDFIDVTPENESLMKRANAVVFGTLAQRNECSRESIQTLLKKCGKDTLKVFDINLRQDFYSPEIIHESLKLANAFKLSDEEVVTVAGIYQLPADPEVVMRAVFEHYELAFVVLTLGAMGSMVLDSDGFHFTPAGTCEKVADTVGCGDSFVSVWCTELLKGKSTAEAMEAASARAAIVAGRPGAMCL